MRLSTAWFVVPRESAIGHWIDPNATFPRVRGSNLTITTPSLQRIATHVLAAFAVDVSPSVHVADLARSDVPRFAIACLDLPAVVGCFCSVFHLEDASIGTVRRGRQIVSCSDPRHGAERTLRRCDRAFTKPGGACVAATCARIRSIALRRDPSRSRGILARVHVASVVDARVTAARRSLDCLMGSSSDRCPLRRDIDSNAKISIKSQTKSRWRGSSAPSLRNGPLHPRSFSPLSLSFSLVRGPDGPFVDRKDRKDRDPCDPCAVHPGLRGRGRAAAGDRTTPRFVRTGPGR